MVNTYDPRFLNHTRSLTIRRLLSIFSLFVVVSFFVPSDLIFSRALELVPRTFVRSRDSYRVISQRISKANISAMISRLA